MHTPKRSTYQSNFLIIKNLHLNDYSYFLNYERRYNILIRYRVILFIKFLKNLCVH